VGAIDLSLMTLDPTSPLLVRRAKAGDRQAFEELMGRHERAVLRTALRILGRLDLAQDAAQEVFLRMHKYLGSFDDDRELGPWLYRVAVNVCRDVGRKSGGPGLVPLDEVEEPPATRAGAGEIEEHLDRERRRALVARALQALPEKERAALVLRDIEGLPTSEVAEILGSSEATVRSQVCTGRVKVKKLVEGFLRGRP
jgi:RNA polymerase sigma-70 factor (ECF subfamily)